MYFQHFPQYNRCFQALSSAPFLHLLPKFFTPLSRWLVGMSQTHSSKQLSKKYGPLNEENQWHKSCIVHNSPVSCTIPLRRVFIIPLKWIYGVGQVEHSHAWTFFTVCFVEGSPKEEQPLIFIAQPVWGVTVFLCVCVNPWVCMVIPEQPQTSTAVSTWGRQGGGSLFLQRRLCKIKNDSLRSRNSLFKT